MRRQSEQWDPVLAWSRDALGARFEVAAGLMPLAQPEQATAAVAAALVDFDAFRLAALHVMTTLVGSALLALAHARGALTAAAAWAAAACRRGLADQPVGRGCRGRRPPRAPLGRDAGGQPHARAAGVTCGVRP